MIYSYNENVSNHITVDMRAVTSETIMHCLSILRCHIPTLVDLHLTVSRRDSHLLTLEVSATFCIL